jgi:4-nitrophenol 2-monooxygenase / 4-nitrocatechol 4-monooxygenase, reductase component
VTAPSKTAISAERYRDAIGRFASGVSIVTTRYEGALLGTTASAVSSVSLQPPMLLVCLNQQSATAQAIVSTQRFAVNILGEQQAELARRFAGSKTDRFNGIGIAPRDHGAPLLADALASLECRLVNEFHGGTHYIFLGEVEHAGVASIMPLVYFRGGFGRFVSG